MKLTKKLEAEVLKVYKAYWDAYLNGEMKSFGSMLDDDITVFGTAISEVFNNKKDTLRFYRATAEQLVGKVQLRNRKINMKAVDDNILINEQFDLYFLMDKKWTFYGHMRVSAILKQTGKGWKLTHQHASFPDMRAEEGEQIAAEKIKEENLLLRDAVKRRTIELEEKNRELEIETSLEKVRAQALGMRKADELMNVCKVLFKELIALGFTGLRNAIIHSFDDDKAYFTDYDYSDTTGGAITNISYNENPIIKKFIKQIRKSDNAFVQLNIKGNELKDWKRFRKKGGQPDDPLLNKASAIHYYLHSIQNASIGISTFNVINKEQLQLLKRFRNVFDFAYRRYMDIAQAEAQTREAQIEVAVERVRAKALAMHRSDEIHDVVRALRNELFGLKLEGIMGATICLKQADGQIRFWDITDVETTGRYGWDIVFDIGKIDSRLWVKKIWDSKKQIISTEQDSSDLKRALKWLGQYDKKTADEIVKLLKINNIKHGWHRAVRLAHGRLITDFANKPPSEIDSILLKIGAAFDLAYKRFLDLQKAEAQAKEARVETALERIRARALAMHSSNELMEVAKVLREQLSLLGQPDLETSVVHLYEEDPGHILSWRAFRSGTGSEITYGYIAIPKNSCEFVQEWLSNYYSNSIEYTIEISGAKQKEWYDVLFKLAPDVINAMRQNKSIHEKRYHQFSKFSGGALLMVSRQRPSEESIYLQRRAALVFDLAYRRFLDLKKAEDQAREAQIEAALERVRSRTMAMHKTSELQEVIHTVHKELVNLNLSIDGGSFVVINEDVGPELRCWGSGGTANTSEEVQVPHFNMPFCTNLIKGIKTGRGFFTEEFSQKEKKEYFTKLFKHKPWSDLSSSQKKETLSSLGGYTRSVAVSKLTTIFVINHQGRKFTEAENDILKRFAKVFEQTYTRFLDLQKAEAQAREAQIEAALEKIRSRSLAMHHSKELKDVIAVLFEKLNELNVLLGTVAIQLFDHKSMNSYLWVGNAIQDPQMVNLPYDKKMMQESGYVKDGWEAMQEGRDIINKEYSLKEKNIFFKYVFANNDLTQVPESAREVLRKMRKHIVCLFTEKNSALFVDSFDGRFFSKENLAVIKRAAKVFEQSYIRFLDLQKAEAQARESQIQLAMERVRARTMAMQRSDELAEVATILFQQVKALGVPQWVCGFSIWEIGDKEFTWYPGSPDGEILTPCKVPLREHPVFISFDDSRKRGDELFVYEKEGEFQAGHYRYMQTLPGMRELLQNMLDAGLQFPTFQIDHIANFSHGNLVFITYEHFPEMHDIFKRFAKVFEQTYTRFLDLQKAEAQAREAQIEAALERVRSRTMAMHKSEELLEVIITVSEQLEQLQFRFHNVSFVVNNKDYDLDYWLASPGQSHPFRIHVPYLDNPVITRFRDARDKGISFYADVLTEEEHLHWIKHMLENSVLKNIPDVDKQYLMSRKGFARSVVLTNHITLVIGNYASASYSDEQNAILKRFANVFEQSYTRFLDLQKAEAQAREAQIEIGLERVRSRAMAMQTSEELNELIGTVFTELTKLDLVLTRSVILIYEGNEKGVRWWMANSEAPSMPASFFVRYTNLPFFNEYLQGWYDRSLKWQYILEGENKVKTDDFLFGETELSRLPDFVIRGMRTPDRVYLNASFNNFGNLTLASLEPLSDEHFDILLRFAKVFDLTYTRFNDLKQAEAQAKESKIQLALERVRARTMAMQRSDELMETAVVLFDQLKQLGENIERTMIGVMNEEEPVVDVWATRPDGSQMVRMQKFPVDEPIVMQKVYGAWRQQKKSIVIDLRGEELESYFQFLKSRSSRLTRESFGERRVENFAFFSKGIMGVINADPDKAANVELYERFAAVFDQTYTRFLDLQKAEEQAREAKIEVALERARTQSMLMQHSNELNDTLQVFHQQLQLLGINSEFSYLWLPDEENDKHVFWAAWGEEKNNEAILKSKAVAYPLDRNEPNTAECLVAWRSGVPVHTYNVAPAGVENYFAAWQELFSDAEKLKAEFFSDGLTYIEAFMKYGCFGIVIRRLLSEDEKKTLLRFTIEFERAYTRFLDLQKAEEQAREAQIELALERVRARTMAMQKSDELSGTSSVLFHELKNLGIETIRSGVGIFNAENDTAELWLTTESDKKIETRIIGSVHASAHPAFQKWFTKWKQKEPSFSFELAGDAVRNYYETLSAYLSLPPRQVYHSKECLNGFFFPEGSLNVITQEPLSEESSNIMLRFARVFGLLYRRFLDLQKAETQAREAQIQLALERVRARTMAMQKSEELAETASLLFKQIRDLGIQTWTSGFNIWEENDMSFIGYNPTPTGEMAVPYHIPSTENSFFKEIYEAKKRGEEFLVFESAGETLVQTYNYMKTLPVVKEVLKGIEDSGFRLPDFQINHCAFFSHGFLLFITQEAYPEVHDIFKRFAKVFDQTYTRFLDLQKAEAQAREAKIEAALERVRSRTMAMHKSEELSEAAFVLFQQFKELGEEPERIFIATFDELHEGVIDLWGTNEGGKQLDKLFQVAADEPTMVSKIISAWRDKKKSTVIDLAGEELHRYLLFLKSAGIPFAEGVMNERRVQTVGCFSKGVIGITTPEPRPRESVELLERFAGVFDLTYTRFLDLQKAEAQAREAHIEAALERVRSRAMAMHKTDELLDGAELIYKELTTLGITSMNVSYAFVDEQEKYGSYYSVNPVDGKTVPFPFVFPHTETDVMRSILSSWKKQEPINLIELDEKATLKHQTYIGEHIQKQITENNPGIPFSIEAFLAVSPQKAVIYNFNFAQGYIFIIGSTRLTTEQEHMVLRFTKVFELTYRRFLDIKQADAQAREAQIELALERVRARTMAMHRSDELAETAQVLFHQLQELGGIPDRIAIGIVDEDAGVVNYWSTDQSGSHIDKKLQARLNERTVLSKTYRAWKDQKKSLVVDLQGDDVKEWIKFAREEIGVVVKDEFIKDRRVHNFAFFSQGWILVTSHEPQTAETIQILERFASVFNLTYRRFLDLEKAEAQANEARIEISLERIRARALAMHKSDELIEVAKVLWEQMALLGQPELEASVVHLYEEEPDHIISSRAVSIGTDSSTKLTYGQMAIPKNSCEVVREWLEKFYSDLKEYTIEISGAKQKEWYELLAKLAPEVVNSMRKENSIHEKRYYRFSKFSGGALLMVSKQEPSEEAAYLQRRAAAVFDLAYRRFSDLQKAETQAREAQIEAGLERVRAKTMAMHNSNDLLDVTHTLSEQLVQLGFEKGGTVSFITDSDDRGYNIWLANPGESFLRKFYVPRINDKSTQLWKEAVEQGRDFYTYVLTNEEKDIFFQNFFENTVLKNYPQEAKQAVYSAPGMATTIVLLDKISLTKSNFTGIPYSDEQNSIIKRFAFVFQQSYTRFLDLQKAEAQAREAQIEAALERVRAKAMAMHKTEDLDPAVAIVFEELRKLEIGVLRCGISVLNKEKRTGDVWVTSSTGQGTAMQVSGDESFDIHPLLQGAFDAWLHHRDFHYVLEGDDLTNYYRAVKAAQFHLPESQFISSEKEHQKQYMYVAFYHAGGLFAFRDTEFTDEAKKVMKRFAKVFDLTYKRFLDIQKAEAQAREAQIEAALERVRSRSLAMHKSDELQEVVNTVFERLTDLNVQMDSCNIAIFKEGTKDYDYWIASPVQKRSAVFHMPYMDLLLTKDLVKAREEEVDTFSRSYSFEEKNEWFDHAYKHSDFRYLPPERKKFIAEAEGISYAIAFAKHTGVQINSYSTKLPSDTDIDILRRFAKVFEQAYIRFLDLEKAEAQAREAQIEAALERVRAKAMAMHKSDDLNGAVKIMFEEFQKLNLDVLRCGIGILNNDSRTGMVWATSRSDGGLSIQLSANESFDTHPLMSLIYDRWKKQEDLDYVLQGQDLVNYYRAMKESDLKLPESQLIFSEDELQPQYYYAAMFKAGGLYAFRDKPFTPEGKKLMKRFASVVNLTYNRFLDLQKAEANAREAQIEAGLERVRSKTMAMHSSDDVSIATATMFTELEKLGIQNRRGGITIIKPDQTQEVWSITNLPDGKMIRAIGVFDMRMHPLWRALFEAQTKKEDYHYYWLAGEEKENYIAILNATPNYLSQPIKVIPDVHVQSYFFGEGSVWTNSLQPHSEEDKQIMKRFASVFSLTFRRYQDLKKAEAQAKEATIEAALEKVRGKAMAMHNSNDLTVTTSIIISELKKLGIKPIRCGVGIINRETHRAQLYTARFSPDGDSLSIVGWVVLKGHPVLDMIYEKWAQGEDYFPELSGDSLKSYYEQLLAGLSVPLPDFKDGQKHYGHFFSVSVGCLYAWADVKYNDDEIKILKRFASIIDLTFRRYFELQKAEENAKETVKQAALDRIRADIASMRTITDLDRITPLIWNELTILGIPFIRCGVFIMDEIQKLIHTFLSTPDGKAIAALHLPYDIPGNISKVIVNWRHKKIYVDHWGEEEFVQFADILMKQGALISREQYLKTIPHGGFYLHFLPFLQGMLYVGNTEQLNEKQVELIQHVADAFSTAYARYEDFNRLEAAKQQVENTLTDLKQAQQQLVQSEKMASLGELTAGIAHEIQNPLNFVNNFSDVSNELLEEMKHELEKGNKEDAIAIVDDVKQNLEKILHHGKRADAIVKGMLQHSRTSSGQKEPTDINVLADEYLRLSFHGLRAKDKSFNAKFETHFDNSIGKVSIIPQDIGRVILNLINNAFYAVTEKKKQNTNGYDPVVTVTTKKENGKVEIKVQDNGNGIPQKVLDKIFQPFFTTKPTGQGTGLGLSLSYDIVKAHNGEIKVETREGEGTEFIIQLQMQ